ncbi:pyridoxamine 5'-phosphate oxidase family protein [Cellulosimicrobium sp. Marseille-Q4280]|jgi:nitroimidazol reductase NimA-like FMN-containing flavoprotein (pyridoxamine 5'-phosphate oxidase superfamily)|uniref:pyridoxamine 5'-phosphate oxidase family protein n=1 Tax=Cellulosimicrobium sp. Marseille-Q4280 TaxID=2937992 RepID=UPI00203D8CFE|nr:pyridoxamine 5'-phosphate oxidase family protein [Cellulosimicrobium sp. Marseille-Q4280]
MTGYTNDAPEVLDATTCWALIAGTRVSRLAVSVRGEPDIYPVSVRAHDGTLTFRTIPGTKLATLVTNDRVALEWDGVDGDSAWSVVVHGTARRLDTAEQVSAAESAAEPLVPLVDVPTEEWVRIDPHAVSGRRFHRAAAPASDTDRSPGTRP